MSDQKQAILNTGVFKEVIPQLFPEAQKTGADQMLVCCPFHDDKNPSLSVNTLAGLFNCFSCGAKGNGFDLYMKVKECDFKTALAELRTLAGITPAKVRRNAVPTVVSTFVYHDRHGAPRYWKKRYEPGFDGKRKKSFAFYHGQLGKQEKKGRGCDPLPYNLHKLAALPDGEPVFFLEGEAKADVLNRWGLCGTSLDSGGQSGKGTAWRKEWDQYFAGREVYILPDNDKTGETYADSLAGRLLPVAGSVKALRLPGLPSKGDIVDWLKKEGGVNGGVDGRSKEAFLALLSTAVAMAPKAKGKKAPSSPDQENRVERGIDAFWPVVASDPLYYTEEGTEYVSRSGRLFLLDSKNRELMEDLRLAGRDLNGKAPSRETITTAIDLLCALARRDGEEVELFNRCGAKGDKFYFDLGNGQAVEIEPRKWYVVDAPVMFKRMRHHKAQAAPSPKGDIKRVLEFCQLPEGQELLFLVTLVTCFIPRIAHPAIHASGCQGAGKSVFTYLWKSLIDPSSVVLSTMPRKPEDLDLLLVRHYGLVLDNLSALNADTCDRLCSFITGGVIEKRTLHTDLETTILKANSIILFSSIGSLHSRPDMTERTIVFELERVPMEKRMEEGELFAAFQEAVPEILGGIFDLLSGAMQIYPDISLARLPRMAGFAKWGYAIAQAMGGRGDEFLNEYANNSTIQTGSLLERDTFFSAIVQAMDDTDLFPLRGSYHEVLGVLAEVAVPGGEKSNFKALDKDYTFPKARGFRRHLERIRIPLQEMGITFDLNDQRTSRGKAFVTFYKKSQGGEVPF